jgi:hypothetical protein
LEVADDSPVNGPGANAEAFPKTLNSFDSLIVDWTMEVEWTVSGIPIFPIPRIVAIKKKPMWIILSFFTQYMISQCLVMDNANMLASLQDSLLLHGL